jgi:hypothetical protein
MKIRNGFVSNSSSSSFICAVCGETFSGWDAMELDFDLCRCDAGHIFCDEHRLVNSDLERECFLELIDGKKLSYHSSDCEKEYKKYKEQSIENGWGYNSYEVFKKETEEYEKKLGDFTNICKTRSIDKDYRNYILESLDENPEALFAFEFECPICSLMSVSDETILEYILKEHKLDKEKISKELWVRFGSYKALQKYLKSDD